MAKQKIVFKRILETGYLFTLFCLPLIFNPFGFDMYETPKNIVFGAMASLLAVGTIADLLSSKKPTVYISKKQSLFFLIYLAIITLSLLTSIRPEVSFFGTYFRQGGVLNMLLYAVFFLLGLFYLSEAKGTSEKKAESLLKVVLSSGLVVAAYALLQALGFDIYDSSVTDIFSGRSFSSLGNPTELGTFLLFPIGAAFYLFATQKRTRLFYGMSIVPLIAAMVLSQSRGAILAVLFCAGLSFLKQFKHNKKALLGILLAGAFALASFIFVYGGNTRSLNSRFIIWQNSIEIVKESPFLGIGLENFPYAFESHVGAEFFQYEDYRDLVDRPHNEFLEVWIHLGLPGLFMLLAYAAYLLRLFWNSMEPEKAIASLTLLALLVANCFGFSLVTQFTFAAAFLSLASHQSHETVSWKWTAPKTLAAFFILFLFLVTFFFRVGVFTLDRNLKAAYMATVSGDAELAAQELDQAIRQGFMFGEVYNKAFTFNLALAETYDLDYFFQKAVSSNEKASELQGETLLNRLNKAKLYELAGMEEEAELVYKKASEELAGNPVLYQNWAELYYKQERYEEAVPIYESLMSLLPLEDVFPDAKRIFWKNHPDFALVFEHIVNTYEILGRSDEALKVEEKLK